MNAEAVTRKMPPPRAAQGRAQSHAMWTTVHEALLKRRLPGEAVLLVAVAGVE